MTPADVVFVPAGGGVLGVKEALEVARGLGPKIVVPMGFSLPGMTVELGPVEAFLREAGVGETEAQARLNVTATNFAGGVAGGGVECAGGAGGEGGAGGVALDSSAAPQNDMVDAAMTGGGLGGPPLFCWVS